MFGRTDGVISAYQAVVQQLADVRPKIENLGDDIFPKGGPIAKSLIEISGKPNSGKTMLLSEIMARCLPPTYFGGRNCDIVFFDLNHKFCITKFVDNIKRIITNSGEPSTPEEVDLVVDSCLESIQILNCYSSEEFDLAIDSLYDILLSNRYIALVALDNIESFYWMDANKKLIRMSTHYNRNITRLKNLCHLHNLTCAYTVDSNYLEVVRSRPSTWTAGPSTKTDAVNYQFHIQSAADGSANLSLFGCGSKSIVIDNEGMHFKSSWK